MKSAQRVMHEAKSAIFKIPGKPVPAARPRVTKHGTYNEQRYKDWLAVAKTYARQEWLGLPPMLGKVEVTAVFTGAHGSADLDNLIKGLLDALQGIIIVNDRQVSHLEAIRETVAESDEGEAGTLVNVFQLRGGTV